MCIPLAIHMLNHHQIVQQSPEDEQSILFETSRPNRLFSEPTLPQERFYISLLFIIFIVTLIISLSPSPVSILEE